MEKYLLDVTSLITLISDLCNDEKIGMRFGDIEEWKIKNKSIYNHILDELNDPVLPKLKERLKNGKLLTTRCAWNKFYEMINSYGSIKEIERMNKMDIDIIEDDMIDEFRELKGKLWSDINKNVFGTAFKNGLTIVTGNVSALKDLMNMGYEIKYIAHRSRCFVSRRYEE